MGERKDERLYASEYCNGLQNSVSGYSGVNKVKDKRKLQISAHSEKRVINGKPYQLRAG